MKISELAKKYDLDASSFENWLNEHGVKLKYNLLGAASIEASADPEELAGQYVAHLAAEQERLAQERQIQVDQARAAQLAEQEKATALAGMLITSGFNFDGYHITKYSGYISGDSAVSMDRPKHGWLGGVNKDVGEDLLEGLAQIRRKALQELKEAAYALGCNAVIGVDFDYLTLDPETATSSGGTLYLPFLFAVTANGNAVVIERNQ